MNVADLATECVCHHHHYHQHCSSSIVGPLLLVCLRSPMQCNLQRQLSERDACTSGRQAPIWHPFAAVPVTRSRNSSCFVFCQATAAQGSPPASKKQKTQSVQTQKLKLPASEFAKIKKAAYVSSSVDLKGCPPQSLPEFAVIGRSNVGKSSLINMLTQSNKLAKVSKQPGACSWYGT